MPHLPPLFDSHTFTRLSNQFLADLRTEHAQHVQSARDVAIQSTIASAQIVRRAASVHNAINAITALPRDPDSTGTDDSVRAQPPNHLPVQRAYLDQLAVRLQDALQHRDLQRLDALSRAAEGVLDSFLRDTQHDPFRTISLQTELNDSAPNPRSRANSWNEDIDMQKDLEPANSTNFLSRTLPAFKRTKSLATDRDPNSVALQNTLHLCGLNFSGLSKRDKLVLWLYILMVLGAIIAVTVVTVDFAKRQINPDSFIRSEVVTQLPAPVVTVCLSQTGVPFSRLQLFNFTDAEGRNIRGADPRGPQTERQSPEFPRAVDRFWDNPNNENCNEKVGDFFPFPLQSLNRIATGVETTKCRPCYRVGRKQLAVVRSTDFRNSSTLSFFTDNYFLQCLKTSELTEDSLGFLHDVLNQNKTKQALQQFNILSSSSGQTPVSDFGLQQFQQITSEQACNIFYFALFPRQTVNDTGGVDVSYQWNGTEWIEDGNGPYFRFPQERNETFFPTEALQLFLSANETTEIDEIGDNRDMILIGPSTQTFANIRPAIVYDEPRFDISSSTSNLRADDVIPIFGYWLVYRIFYNYNRFVVDEWYRESTYPVSQWLVDFTGYASLFTGASLFSLILLPLLRAMQKREKQRLRQKNPEVYVWSKHRRGYQEHGDEFGIAGTPDTLNRSRSTVLLPGYNL